MPSTRPVELRAEIGLRCWSGTGNLMPQSHRHNDLEINLVERGQFIYLFGGKRIYIGAGQIALFWAAMPHQLIEIAPETYAHWLTLPLAWFLQRGFAAHLIQPLLEGVPQISDARPNDMAALAQWREDLSLPSDDRHAVVYLEMEARLRRWEWSMQECKRTPKRSVSHKHPNDKVESMADWIAHHCTEPITVAQVARVVNLHPNYAMNLFRRTFGVSMIDYVTQHRVALAQQLLVTTDHDVLSVALQSGFGSSSQFYTAFKRLCGRAPRAYRASLR